MASRDSCVGADDEGLICVGGWLYSSINMMTFPANKRCPRCNKEKEVRSLNVFTNLETGEVDVWEVDYFDTDPNGRKLAGPLLGVRVNGGVWLEVSALMKFIEERKTEL